MALSISLSDSPEPAIDRLLNDLNAGLPVVWSGIVWLGEEGQVNAPAELPDDYLQLLDRLKSQVRQARIRATRIVNTELLTLYWDIGHAIVERQQVEGWGAKVSDRLAVDLRSAFPDMRGFSRTNLKYMRQMAAVWTRDEIGQQPVGQLPWGQEPIAQFTALSRRKSGAYVPDVDERA